MRSAQRVDRRRWPQERSALKRRSKGEAPTPLAIVLRGGLGKRLMPLLRAALVLLRTARLHNRTGVEELAALGVEFDLGLWAPAEPGGEDDQAALASEELEVELGDRRVGDRFEGVSKRPLYRVGAAGEGDLDR